MKLNLDTLSPGRSAIEVELAFRRELESPETDNFILKGELVVDNTTSYVLVSGDIQVNGQYDCDRCLELFMLEYTAPVEILIQRSGYAGQDDESDIFEIHQQRGIVDLDEALREAAMIGWPQHTICADACRGFCASCGQNLNEADCRCEQETVDPRWENLPDA